MSAHRPDTPQLSAVQIAELLGQHRPTDEQVAVIEAPLEPLLVVAGAGSGKTETMASRVVFLIVNGLVDAEQVLGLTFTRKAAGELSDRVRRRLRAVRLALGQDARRSALAVPTVSTYNAYAAGLVGDHALRLGLEPSARLLGEAGRWQLAHDLVEQWTSDLEVDLAPSTITTAVLDLAGALAEHLVDPEELRHEAQRLVDRIAEAPTLAKVTATQTRLVQEVRASLQLRSRLVDLVEAFAERKREDDVMDFADQVAVAARLAREVPEVGAGERARYGVVLLDEYQDTSVAQLELLRHLFGSGTEAGRGHPVTAVGDPHQAIYGWRGASAGGLARFPDHFPGADRPTEVLALATSWRNDRTV
ncbi:UvrD-helicase domain-containing protein, partial [Actinotalea sp. C106]|uniref:UvrD-helicase domain-containing protein n=1 Tax=Actinotalea sp. C106 TaxID=2908644 RepID=UPI00202781A8